METIKMWAVGVCASAIIAAVYKILMPAGNMKKVSEVLLSLFILIALVSPFLQSEASALNFDFLESDFLEQTQAADPVLENYRTATVRAVQSVLGGMGISDCEIEANMHTDADGNIVLNKLCLSVKDLEEAERMRIRREISEKAGISEDLITFVQ